VCILHIVQELFQNIKFIISAFHLNFFNRFPISQNRLSLGHGLKIKIPKDFPGNPDLGCLWPARESACTCLLGACW
jgi:hypothetical protein